MRQKNRPSPDRNAPSPMEKLEVWIPIVLTLLGTLLTWSQLRIAQSEEERARRAEPLAYTLEAVNTHYQYEIQTGTGSSVISLPSPSFRLQVTHGSLHSITAISFDGTEFHELSSLPIRDSWSRCLVDITMPAYSVIAEGDLIYDYFFLLLEPTEGQRQLDLIYSTIDLDTRQVQNHILHPVSLIQLDFLREGPYREMLTVYNSLLNHLERCALL